MMFQFDSEGLNWALLCGSSEGANFHQILGAVICMTLMHHIPLPFVQGVSPSLLEGIVHVRSHRNTNVYKD